MADQTSKLLPVSPPNGRSLTSMGRYVPTVSVTHSPNRGVAQHLVRGESLTRPRLQSPYVLPVALPGTPDRLSFPPARQSPVPRRRQVSFSPQDGDTVNTLFRAAKLQTPSPQGPPAPRSGWVWDEVPVNATLKPAKIVVTPMHGATASGSPPEGGRASMPKEWKRTLPLPVFQRSKAAAKARLAEAALRPGTPAKFQPAPRMTLRAGHGPSPEPELQAGPPARLRRLDSGSLKRTSGFGRNRPPSFHGRATATSTASVSPSSVGSTSPGALPSVRGAKPKITFAQNIKPLLDDMFLQAEFNITHDVLVGGTHTDIKGAIDDNMKDMLRVLGEQYGDADFCGDITEAVERKREAFSTFFEAHMAQLSAPSKLGEIESIFATDTPLTEDGNGQAHSDFIDKAATHASAISKVLNLALTRATKTLSLMVHFKALADKIGRVQIRKKARDFQPDTFDQVKRQLEGCVAVIASHPVLQDPLLTKLTERMGRDSAWYRAEFAQMARDGKQGSARYAALKTRRPGPEFVAHYKENWPAMVDVCCALDGAALSKAVRLLNPK